jgi:hypothetical protein
MVTVTDEEYRSTSALPIVDALGEQFQRLDQKMSRPRAKRRLLRPLALAMVGALLIATAAGAATGVLSVGSVIPGGGDSGFEHDAASPEQTVLATGTAPVAGPWQLTTYRSEGIVDDQGDVAEPKGMPCIRFLLTAPPATNPINGSAFCLAPGKAEFNTMSIPVLDEASEKSELVLYGFAPRNAASVQLTAADGKTIRTDTEPGGTKFPGTTWVIAAPPGLEAAELDWVDRSGNRAGSTIDASPHFDRLEAVTK